jgi:hypothetical protein
MIIQRVFGLFGFFNLINVLTTNEILADFKTYNYENLEEN